MKSIPVFGEKIKAFLMNKYFIAEKEFTNKVGDQWQIIPKEHCPVHKYLCRFLQIFKFFHHIKYI